jgi:hypothetical protein
MMDNSRRGIYYQGISSIMKSNGGIQVEITKWLLNLKGKLNINLRNLQKDLNGKQEICHETLLQETEK